MSENHTLYRQYVNYYYGDIEVSKLVFDTTKHYIINQLKTYGTSKATQDYLYRRKFDRTNDYMLDTSDAMESYSKRTKNPSYKHMCAVLLQGEL